MGSDRRRDAGTGRPRVWLETLRLR